MRNPRRSASRRAPETQANASVVCSTDSEPREKRRGPGHQEETGCSGNAEPGEKRGDMAVNNGLGIEKAHAHARPCAWHPGVRLVQKEN
jgi:hypothetical protein